ncbi:hypothetical protein J6590_086907, partial [Homalodisca vitripennis]
TAPCPSKFKPELSVTVRPRCGHDGLVSVRTCLNLQVKYCAAIVSPCDGQQSADSRVGRGAVISKQCKVEATSSKSMYCEATDYYFGKGEIKAWQACRTEIRKETLCRKCGEADETAKHVIFEFPALQSKRSRSLGVLMHTEEGLEQESTVQKISWFCKGLGFDK